MSANLKELRKEAYRLWGIGSKKVIFDIPKSAERIDDPIEFRFKLNFEKRFISWPKSYAITIEGREPLSRIIVPIILIQQYQNFTIESPAWYDMSTKMHENIVSLINESTINKKLNLFQRLWNKWCPQKMHYSDVVSVEDYVFSVSSYNNNSYVRIVDE